MDRLIQDLLTYSRISGREMTLEPVSLDKLVREVVQLYPEMRPEKADIEVEGPLPDVIAHEPSLTQVISNLLVNALQYSPADTLVRVATRSEEDSLILEIHNTGTPIPQELLPRIFEPMERGNELGDQAGGNIGLGLYIVRHIVLAHEGTVDVHSSATEGTTFTVRLPRRPSVHS